MIEKKYFDMKEESEEMQKRLEIIFDFRDEGKILKKEISKRMKFKLDNTDKLEIYFAKQESLNSPDSYYNKYGFLSANFGNYYSSINRELYLKKKWFKPVLKIEVYADKDVRDDKLLNIERLEHFLKTGEMNLPEDFLGCRERG
jgi:hypothetical protein